MAGKTPKTAVKNEGTADTDQTSTHEVGTTVPTEETTVKNEGTADTDQTNAHVDGTTVSTEVNVERKAVTFLGPYHRYSRGDVACFDVQYAEALVERRIAVWPEDAKKVLSPQSGASDHDTDIG
ncbi:hypothetical protein CB680_20420 [Salmonella enterica subsp. enterica serovar Agama]|nr:hypothetical protein [Salmonella enterica subsp. enterica serovar Agama]